MAGGEQARRGPVRAAGRVAVTRGVHRAQDGDELEAWQLVLPPGGRFTHLTSAARRGWWLPPLPDDLPVFVACPGPARPQRRGMVAFRHLDLPPHQLVRGVRLDPPAETLLACARHLGLLDLVVLLDSALRNGSTRAEIEAVARSGRRGTPTLRRAVALSDGRSESPFETLLRLLHVFCDVEVEPQFVLDDESGGFVARADLWLVGTTALHEYDGAEHLTKRRQRVDLRRARRIGNETWIRRGYTDDDVLHRAVTILRDADLSIGRVHEPSRIRAWHRELGESLFTPAGHRRLRERLGLSTCAPAVNW